MKFLAYVHAYVPDHGAGAETTLHDLLRALTARGHDCTVLLSRRFENDNITDGYTIDGVEVVPYDEVDREQPARLMIESDCVVTHLDSTERVTAMRHIHGKPIIQVVHNSMKITTGYLALGADLVVYNTEWVKEAHENALKDPVVAVGIPGGMSWKPRIQDSWESVVVHPPVHAERYAVKRTDDYVTLINLWPGGTYGGLPTGKGPEVFYELARRFPNQRFLGVIGGYGEQLIEDLPNVTIMPNQADPREIYKRTKVLLMPSRYESFGRVAVEAAASSIPTIACPTPGLVEALGAEHTLFAEYEHIDNWTRKLATLLTSNIRYDSESRAALERSAYWDERIPAELNTFCDAAEEVARKG